MPATPPTAGPKFSYLAVLLTLFVDTINEWTNGAGVTVAGLNLKSGGIGTAGTPMNIAGNGKYIPASFNYGDVLNISQPFFIASRAYLVQNIECRPLVVGSDGGGVTAIIEKLPSGTAPGGGTSLHAAGNFDLKGVVNVNQVAQLAATAALTLAVGDALGVAFTGVQTAARGVITVALIPI